MTGCWGLCMWRCRVLQIIHTPTRRHFTLFSKFEKLAKQITSAFTVCFVSCSV